MLYCPRCQSPNIEPNKLDPIYMDRAVQFAQAAQTFGNARLSALSGIGALLMKAIDVVRADHRCLDCDHRFDDADCGVTRHG